jgi:hypothetical protein
MPRHSQSLAALCDPIDESLWQTSAARASDSLSVRQALVRNPGTMRRNTDITADEKWMRAGRSSFRFCALFF